MKRPQTIISLAAGESQVPLIRVAKELGFKVIAIDCDSSAPGFDYSDISIIESTHNINAVILALKRYAYDHAYRGVLARTTGRPLHAAAAISREFKLPGLTDEFVRIATEKSSLREFCTRFDINCPKGVLADDEATYNYQDFPVILKPDKSSIGKTGIYLCDSHQDVLKYFSRVSDLSTDNKVEIESYIDGIDCTCLCWARKGKLLVVGWLDELGGIDNYGKITSLGLSIPSVITNTRTETIAEDIIKQIIQVFSSVDALLLVSFRITMKGTPNIIEIHADLGGDLIAEKLLPAASTKFNFFKVALQVATGKKMHIKRLRFKPTLLCYEPKSNKNGRQEAIIFQKGDVLTNLLHLENFVHNDSAKYRVIPKHMEWLRMRSDGN